MLARFENVGWHRMAQDGRTPIPSCLVMDWGPVRYVTLVENPACLKGTVRILKQDSSLKSLGICFDVFLYHSARVKVDEQVQVIYLV